jgi:asparagine synthetase B (glutamine-hydrolysing)
MSRISGFYNAAETSEVGEPDLRCALRALRGASANGLGMWVGAEVGLGLACQIGRGGDRPLAQPLHSPDRRFVMVFDGEIYNAAELAMRVTRRSFLPRCGAGVRQKRPGAFSACSRSRCGTA